MQMARPDGVATDSARQQQLAQGFSLLQQDRLVEAAAVSERLLATHADDAEVLFFASEVQLAADDPEAALGFIAAAVEAAPDQAPLLLKKADCLIMLRRRTDARHAASEAAVVAGQDADALWAVAKLYSRLDDPAQALELYAKALAAGHDAPGLVYDLAAAQFYTGDIAGAETNLEAFLARAPKAGHALYLRSTLRRQTEAHNHVVDLQTRLAAGFPDPVARAACLFALAKELEDLGKDDASFAALTEAAMLKRQSLTYDAAAERASIDAVGKTYTADAMQALPAGHEEQGAIFIVGMPRTGTTLLERMLGRHGDVSSAGELLDFGQILAAAARKRQLAEPDATSVEASLQIDFAALGRDYMASARQAAAGSRMFIDKMPINYIYSGMIRKALPNARIIHLVRDPMDSGYAVYKTLFNQAYYFSYDLDELAAYYTSYHHLMRHWHAVMPGEILDVRYEDLVSDPEGQLRRILLWCGLDWDDAVLAPWDNESPSTTASAAQVREAVYTSSVHKWRRHQAGLAPLEARLSAAGILNNAQA